METLILLLLILFLVLCSAFFSGSEVALFSLSQHKVKVFEQSKESNLQQIATLLRHPRDLLVTVFMLNTLVNILLQNVTSHLFGEESNWLLKVGIPFGLLLLFGEVIPKQLGLQHNLFLSQKVAPVIATLQNFLAPIRRGTIALTAPVSKLLFFQLHKERGIDREEIGHALKMAQKQGIVEEAEVEWATGYLDLLDTTVEELMHPKEDVLFYDIQTPISKLTHLFVEEQCSRIPVCDGSLDSILGIIHASDFFIHRQNIAEGISIAKFLKKPLFIPELTSGRALLGRFYRQREVIALAVDEYGGVSGLIALEDIAEVVIGKIVDNREQKALYTRSGENEIIASGKLELEELNALFGTELSSDQTLTVGGWLTEQIDAIPSQGFTYEKDGVLFKVLTATKKRVQRLYIRKLAHQQGRQ